MAERAGAAAPTDDLVRAVFPTSTLQPVELRAATVEDGGDSGDVETAQRTLFGHFAVFNTWTEINNYWEGRFMEQLAPGCFSKTMAEQRDAIKVLYDHGYDPQLGNKPLGPLADLREDGVGGYYEVPLIDTSYNRDFVIPAAEVPGLLGASFRFRIIKDEWNEEPGRSDHNPDGIPERTIREVRLYELGPVTFGAYQEATAGLRSRADVELWRSLDEDGRAELAALIARAHTSRTPDVDEAARGTSTGAAGAAAATTEKPADATSGLSTHERSRLLRLQGVIQ